MAGTDTQINLKTNQRIREPTQWQVIFINDNTTTVEFVIDTLMSIFGHDQLTAETIAEEIHETGAGIAGVYSFEIAETKASESISLARASNFPLQVKIEELN